MAGPGESPDLEVDAVAVVVLHGLVVDDVDDGDDEGLGLLLDPVQQRLHPVVAALAVRVQEHEHVAGGQLGPDQPRLDEAVPRPQPLQLHLGGELLEDVPERINKRAGIIDLNI